MAALALPPEDTSHSRYPPPSTLTTAHPPPSRRPLLAYVKSIQGTRDLAQIAWNFINDSLRTTICLQVL